MTEMEKMALDLFSQKFGQDITSRFIKLNEEYNELINAFTDYTNNLPGSREHLIDELSDVQAVLTHISGILHIDIDELLINAIVKVKVREVNPMYKKTVSDFMLTEEKICDCPEPTYKSGTEPAGRAKCTKCGRWI
jgi:NTP pyrophosphatase (non-canonical NTP hydrolase)